MGASGWFYFVPYQEDINQALQDLRKDVFARGDYQKPDELLDPAMNTKVLQQALDLLEARSPRSTIEEQQRQQLESILEMMKGLKPRKRKRAKTIKDLLRQCAENGTHSILDIERIAAEPDFAAIWTLSREQLLDFFGTDQPMHEQVETWSQRIDPIDAKPLYERWQGIYVVVYQDGQPAEIYFEGCSGD